MLDATDIHILKLLDWHGRMPISQLAKKLCINKDVAANRIRKLEQSAITGYYPVLDLTKLGYITHRFNFAVNELPPQKEKQFVEFLDKTIHAGLIYRMDGEYRYGIYVWTKEMYTIEGILAKIRSFLGSYLRAYRYNVLFSIRQYPKDAVFNEKTHTQQYKVIATNAVRIDADDLKILRALTANSRLSTMDISRKTSIPQSTVSYKIKKLEREKVICGYRANIDVQQLGFQHYAVEVHLNDQPQAEKLVEWANADPNTTWYETAVGGPDIDLVLEVKSREELEQKLDVLRTKFPAIQRLVPFTEHYWKLTYLPS